MKDSGQNLLDLILIGLVPCQEEKFGSIDACTEKQQNSREWFSDL